MNRLLISSAILCVIIIGPVSGQDIRVVPGDTPQLTTVKFSTTSGEYIPLFRFLNSSSSDLGDITLVVHRYQDLGFAPTTLEFQPGLYTIQMYQDGIGRRFQIQATGGTQEWLLKPKGDQYDMTFIETAAASVTTVGLFIIYSLTHSTYTHYLEDPSSFHFDPPNTGNGYLIASGISLGVLLTALVTNIVQAPRATRIR